MSATATLKAAHAAGIRLGIDGDALVLEASAPPSPALLDLLARHKADILELLRRPSVAEDWRAFVTRGLPPPAHPGERAEAIATAICNLGAGDVLLVAGKGHETGQIVGATVTPFNDVDVVRGIVGAKV